MGASRRTDAAGSLLRSSCLPGRHLVLSVRIRLFGLFLKLVAGARAGSGANGATNHGTRRAGPGPTQNGATDRTGGSAGSGSGLLVTVRGLAGHGTTGRANGTAHGGAHRTADHTANSRAPDSAGRAANGFAGMLLVVGGSAIGIAALRIEA